MSYESIPIPEELGRRLQQGFLLSTKPRTLGELAKADFEPCAKCSPSYLISDKPTRHQVRIANELLYTHCVIDTLALPSLRAQTAEISSLDPVTGQEIQFRLSPQGLESPDDALLQTVVSIGASASSVGSGHKTCCPFINLFTTRNEYEVWIDQHPEAIAIALSLKDALALAREWLTVRLSNNCC